MEQRHFLSENPVIILLQNFHKVVYLVDREARKLLDQDSLITFMQFRILVSVLHSETPSQQDIAECLGVTEASMSRQVSALQKKGFLSRVIDTKNRRRHQLTITPQGRRTVKIALGLLEKHFSNLEDITTAHEMQVVNSMSEKIIHKFIT